MRWTRALVTGATSGIGWEMAHQLAAEGTSLVAVARSTDVLAELERHLPVEVETITADLADPEAVEHVAQRIADDLSPLDLVVNNAGFGTVGPFIEQSAESQAAMVHVNVAALVRLSHAAAVTFSRRNRGTILNVSSVASFTPGVGTTTYNATKAFVTSFTQSLHQELLRTDVNVSALCPGLTRTDFQRRAEFDASGLPDVLWQEASDVAAAGLAGAWANRAVVVSGVQNKVAVGALKLMPSVMQRRLSGLLAD